MADARRAALEKLGPAAVVITTRTVRRPGIGGLLGASDVEIAALAQRSSAPPPAPSRPEAEVPFAAAAYANGAKTSIGDFAALRAELKGDIRTLKAMLTKVDGVPDTLASEIAQLRELVEALSATKAPQKDKVASLLRGLGLEGPAAHALARKLRKSGLPALREELASIVRVAGWPLDGERVLIALVGPSGVGKTTTAAKLAARATMAGRTVTLVACDTYRVGAVEQIARYAQLLRVECVKASTPDELRAILDAVSTDVVIVDTSGRPPTADGVETALAPGRKSARSPSQRARHVLLCLPASVRASDATRVVRRYAPLAPDALAITKVDETDTPAGIVHSSWASKLPIGVVCNGQRVPEDIARATLDILTAPFAASAEEPAVTS
jgi:flagellar biosynthesis protein FlhF